MVGFEQLVKVDAVNIRVRACHNFTSQYIDTSKPSIWSACNSIEFGILPVLLAVLSANMEHSVPEYILCGILIAVIVLANPFALLMYGMKTMSEALQKLTGGQLRHFLRSR